MEASSEVLSSGAAEGERVARFGGRARWGIVIFLAVFTAGMLLHRALRPENAKARYADLRGETQANVFLYLGPPQRENDDGRGGRVMHYDEWQVIGDHFEKREFRVFVSADGRVNKVERD